MVLHYRDVRTANPERFPEGGEMSLSQKERARLRHRSSVVFTFITLPLDNSHIVPFGKDLLFTFTHLSQFVSRRSTARFPNRHIAPHFSYGTYLFSVRLPLSDRRHGY